MFAQTALSMAEEGAFLAADDDFDRLHAARKERFEELSVRLDALVADARRAGSPPRAPSWEGLLGRFEDLVAGVQASATECASLRLQLEDARRRERQANLERERSERTLEGLRADRRRLLAALKAREEEARISADLQAKAAASAEGQRATIAGLREELAAAAMANEGLRGKARSSAALLSQSRERVRALEESLAGREAGGDSPARG